jgi:ferritin
MVSKKIEKALNDQIRLESESSQLYLAMACWAEANGFEGVSEFMYDQSDEERQHMLKIIKFLNNRGGTTVVTELSAPKYQYDSIRELFENLLKHEIFISEKINDLVHLTFELKDFATHSFLQWYVIEQIEEEATARNIIDKMNLIGDNVSSLYLFDNEIKKLRGNIEAV